MRSKYSTARVLDVRKIQSRAEIHLEGFEDPLVLSVVIRERKDIRTGDTVFLRESKVSGQVRHEIQHVLLSHRPPLKEPTDGE